MSHFHGFETFEKRGHHYELFISSEKGRLTADYIASKIHGSITDKNIFFCGSSTMMHSLSKQFRQLGVPEKQLIIEDFNLL